MPPYHNTLLDAFSAAEPDFVRERAVPFSFAHGDLLVQAGQSIEHVYFPQSGLISVVVGLSGGEHIEAAMIGHDGALGASVACGATSSVNTAFGQVAGHGWRLAAADVVTLADENRALQNLLFRHEQFLLAQAQQTAACNARHHIPARLCSWLMRAHEFAQGEIYVTQELLAQILGVQRASISLIASTLQDAGLIQYRRGRLSILDKPGLAQRACECHQVLHDHRHYLFHAQPVAALASR